jgi:hypothetical protein
MDSRAQAHMRHGGGTGWQCRRPRHGDGKKCRQRQRMEEAGPCHGRRRRPAKGGGGMASKDGKEGGALPKGVAAGRRRGPANGGGSRASKDGREGGALPKGWQQGLKGWKRRLGPAKGWQQGLKGRMPATERGKAVPTAARGWQEGRGPTLSRKPGRREPRPKGPRRTATRRAAKRRVRLDSTTRSATPTVVQPGQQAPPTKRAGGEKEDITARRKHAGSTAHGPPAGAARPHQGRAAHRTPQPSGRG